MLDQERAEVLGALHGWNGWFATIWAMEERARTVCAAGHLMWSLQAETDERKRAAPEWAHQAKKERRGLKLGMRGWWTTVQASTNKIPMAGEIWMIADLMWGRRGDADALLVDVHIVHVHLKSISQ